jgi:hypothetical protein
MVLGIIGLVGLCVYGLGVVPAIIGLVLGFQARDEIAVTGPARLAGSGQATAGIVLCWITVGLVVAAVAVGLIALATG